LNGRSATSKPGRIHPFGSVAESDKMLFPIEGGYGAAFKNERKGEQGETP
jgi:hypothetical protein